MAVSPQDPRQGISTKETDIVRAVHTRPDRVVLITDGSADAWIASDLLVDVAQ